MQITKRFLKHKHATPYQANSHGQHDISKHYSRKKVITPITSVAAIRKEMQPSRSSLHKAPVKNQKKFLTVNLTENAGHEKLIALSSNLDEKLIRRRKLFAFIAKVVLWSIIFYVLILSALPMIEMVLSRWNY
jgi:hypothetical protein